MSPRALPPFLGVAVELMPDPPRVTVLPVAYEATVTYKRGTRKGPAAILEASTQVELFDRDLNRDAVFDYGIRTLPLLKLASTSPRRWLERIAGAVEAILRQGSFPLVLGGEHGLSVGVGRALFQAYGPELAIVYFDAHSDLREDYKGEPYSHACAARRLLEEGFQSLIQIGIRSCCREEAEFARSCPKRVLQFSAERVRREPEPVRQELKKALQGRRVFLSFDVDALDPAVMPATGTPEPGGLSFPEALELLGLVCRSAEVKGMDCVELSPRDGLHYAEFSVAVLLYRTLNQIFRRL